jgi:hypothetical protein
MSQERRRAERVKVNLDVRWEGHRERSQGTISDISSNGCFVLCSGAVKDGEPVKIEFILAREKVLAMAGEVVNHVDEIGFGMQFAGVGKQESTFLKRLIERARDRKNDS